MQDAQWCQRPLLVTGRQVHCFSLGRRQRACERSQNLHAWAGTTPPPVEGTHRQRYTRTCYARCTKHLAVRLGPGQRTVRRLLCQWPRSDRLVSWSDRRGDGAWRNDTPGRTVNPPGQRIDMVTGWVAHSVRFGRVERPGQGCR